MRKIFYLILLVILTANVNGKIKIITGHLPPYSCESATGKGIFYEIIENLSELENDKYQAYEVYYPWKRALKMSLEYKKFIIFPLARIKEREEKYLWVGSILSDEMVFVYKKSSMKKYEDLSFKEFALIDSNIMVLDKAPPMIHLKNYNFRNLYLTNGEDLNCIMLVKERYDVWYTTEFIALNTIKEKGYNKDDFVFKGSGEVLDFYFAVSTLLPNEAAILQRQVDELKADGTIDKIIAKYKGK